MRRAVPLTTVAFALAGCGGGGDGGGDSHALGEQVVVDQTEASGAKRSSTLGMTVSKVREGRSRS